MNDHQTSYPLGGQVNESVEWGSLEAQPCSELTTWAIGLVATRVLVIHGGIKSLGEKNASVYSGVSRMEC